MMPSPRQRLARRTAAVAAMALAVTLAACAGENLFSLAAAVGAAGPEVTISSPGDAFTIAAGDSVRVVAEVNAPDGVASTKTFGVFKVDGAAAFVLENQTFGGVPFLNLDNWITAAAGGFTGEAYIIVEATDGLGAVAADSVQVLVN